MEEGKLPGVGHGTDMSLRPAWRQDAGTPAMRAHLRCGTSQIGAVKLEMEKQISVAWFDPLRPKASGKALCAGQSTNLDT